MITLVITEFSVTLYILISIIGSLFAISQKISTPIQILLTIYDIYSKVNLQGVEPKYLCC